MNTSIVTGATGFIGKALVEYLAGNGEKVYAVVRDKKKQKILSGENISIIQADFENYDSLSAKIENADIFYHLAWTGAYGTDVSNFAVQLNNVAATCKALEQAIKIGCKKFVFAGTVAELEVIEHIDNNICSPRNTCIYSTAKLCAEMMCKTLANKSNIEFNTGLFANIFGPGDYSRRSTNIIVNQIDRGIAPKLVKGDGLNDWLYIKDAVRLISAMAEKGISNKTYYIGHTELRPLREIISDVSDILAPDLQLTFGTLRDEFLTNYSYIKVDELFQDTGFKAEYPFHEAIVETADWVRSLNMEIL